MNIVEEIKNITNYIDKIENNIIIENNRLLSQEEISITINKLLDEIKNIDNKLIDINNDINKYSTNKKKIISNEKRIYNNELNRIAEKCALLKETNNIILQEQIKYGINLFAKKKLLLNEIQTITDKINSFNKLKHETRQSFIKSIKVVNTNIKHNRTSSELQDIKKSIINIDTEINQYDNKKNGLINTITDNNELIIKIADLDNEQRKLLKKRDILLKYLKNNSVENTMNKTNNKLLKTKLPTNYREYKNLLCDLKKELLEHNKLIMKHTEQLIKIEKQSSDIYIEQLLDNEKTRCLIRWEKMNKRVEDDIITYKNSFADTINKLQSEKTILQHKLSLLKNNSISISTTEKQNIQKNNELLSTIKNRLNYLKKLKT